MWTRRQWLGVVLETVACGVRIARSTNWRVSNPVPRVALLETHVAGYRFHEGPAVEESLTPAMQLVLRREPWNAFDAGAIAVWTSAGAKLGFLPRSENRTLARLMDAGVPVTARVTEVRREAPPWKRLWIVVEGEIAREDRAS